MHECLVQKQREKGRMYTYIHSMQSFSGMEVKITVEIKYLCDVFVTARAHAKHPSCATVGLYLALMKFDSPCLASVFCFHQPYQCTFLHGFMFCLKKRFVYNLYLYIP